MHAADFLQIRHPTVRTHGRPARPAFVAAIRSHTLPSSSPERRRAPNEEGGVHSRTWLARPTNEPSLRGADAFDPVRAPRPPTGRLPERAAPARSPRSA